LVADFHAEGLTKPADPMIIAPIPQVSDGYNAAYANIQPLFWMVRTHGDPHTLIPSISEQLRIVSDGFAVGHIRTMDEVMGNSTARQSFNMLLLTIFGAVALLLAAIGIYGVMAYSVAQRTREIGILMALGAQRGQVLRMIVLQGAKMAVAGVAIGIGGALALTRVMASLLYEVSPTDILTFSAVAIVVLIMILLACFVPSLKATRIDPMIALRYE
jgi:ABC-type antimicrobial peptide transport system permease subunit